MPATLTPPELSHPEVEDIDAGGGGRRPPINKRTGGNDNGDDDAHFRMQPAGRRGPRDLISQYRSGLFFALAADALMFVALGSSFLVTKHASHVDAYGHFINSWLAIELPPILWLNTGVILISSITAEIARRTMFNEHNVLEEWIGLGRKTSRRAMAWLIATLVLGFTFLLGQWAAWLQLGVQRRSWSLQSSKFFYIFTALHALHILVGITAMMVAIVGLARSRKLLQRQILVDTTVWYWHAMGALWVALFVLLEYFQ